MACCTAVACVDDTRPAHGQTTVSPGTQLITHSHYWRRGGRGGRRRHVLPACFNLSNLDTRSAARDLVDCSVETGGMYLARKAEPKASKLLFKKELEMRAKIHKCV